MSSRHTKSQLSATGPSNRPAKKSKSWARCAGGITYYSHFYHRSRISAWRAFCRPLSTTVKDLIRWHGMLEASGESPSEALSIMQGLPELDVKSSSPRPKRCVSTRLFDIEDISSSMSILISCLRLMVIVCLWSMSFTGYVILAAIC